MYSNDGNDPADFYELEPEQQNILVRWIKGNLHPIKSTNRRHSSYGLKHAFDRPSKGGFYVVNGVFKGVMLEAGFRAHDTTALNWCFNISERSPVFKRGRAYPTWGRRCANCRA